MNTNDPDSPSDDSIQSSLGRMCEHSTNYIRENPVYAVIGALAAGFVVGWLLPHRERTWKERYVFEPSNRVKDFFASAAESAGERLAEVKDTVTDAASNAACAVGKGLGKLKFWS
jgi:hypothetical protein